MMGGKRQVELARFEEVPTAVRCELPHLRIDVIENDREVDAMACFPVQEGLEFDVCINLQNRDELHLNVSRLRVEWFPCGDQFIDDRFIEAVVSVLSGRGRIVERLVLGQFISATLEVPKPDGSWRTLGSCSNLNALLPWPRSRRVLPNCARQTVAMRVDTIPRLQ